MAMSGVKADQLCIDVFNKQKLGTKNRKWINCVSYRISDDGKRIEVEYIVTKSGKKIAPTEEEEVHEEMPPEALWDLFKSSLPADECRYYTYDFAFTSKSGQKHEKISFIAWAPDTAKIKAKMLIASSKDYLKKTLVGIGHECQASGLDELESYEEFGNKIAHSKS